MTKKRKPTLKDNITEKVLEAIAKAEESAAAGETTMVLSSGVRVTLHRLPPLLQRAVEAKFTEPTPPMVEVKVHGKKETQPNPDDPDYLKAKEHWARDRGAALMDLALIKGIDVELPKDEGWLDELRLVGIEVGETEVDKKLAYLRSVAIGSLEDLMGVTGRVLAMSGVTSRAVDEATKTA